MRIAGTSLGILARCDLSNRSATGMSFETIATAAFCKTGSFVEHRMWCA